MKILIENNINSIKSKFFKNDYKVNNSEAKENEFIETKKVKYDASIPKYPNVENYYEGYNYYADIHQYYLLKKKNIANLCLYLDYINNIKNKGQLKNKKNNFRTKTSSNNILYYIYNEFSCNNNILYEDIINSKDKVLNTINNQLPYTNKNFEINKLITNQNDNLNLISKNTKNVKN